MHVSHVLVGPEPQFQELAEAALKVMKEAGAPLPETSTMLVYDDIFKDDTEPFELLPQMKVSWDDPALVQHSSGKSKRIQNV